MCKKIVIFDFMMILSQCCKALNYLKVKYDFAYMCTTCVCVIILYKTGSVHINVGHVRSGLISKVCEMVACRTLHVLWHRKSHLVIGSLNMNLKRNSLLINDLIVLFSKFSPK
ncbi:hypothetical protein HOLleu_05258 [Holothuria leucospilota]|uniref:Secreted protein n=1 Tax=Holothuria leucospilota TaxID=206669 RepID=A0A9Q1CKH1_HOLLE|nr:hypothetical protein HOLleu_05258 [Holothuria leucospilota]